MKGFFLFFIAVIGLDVALAAERTFYLTPDHFAIEIVNGVPSFRVTEDRFGPIAAMTFVPGYDSSLSALGYAFSQSHDEVEVIPLPVEVVDFNPGDRPLLQSPGVRGVEKEKFGHRVVLRIRFTKDFTVAQVRMFMGLGAVQGMVETRLGEGESVPKILRGLKLDKVPAFNQFQAEGREADGKKMEAAKYAALSQYKAELLMKHGGRLGTMKDLDTLVRNALFVVRGEKVRECRRDLSAYQDWMCRIVLEQSREGSLGEALFVLARSVFPARLVGHNVSRFIFDGEGRAVNWLNQGVPSPDAYAGPSEFERILASRANPSIKEQVFENRVREYARTLFYTVDFDDREKITQSLLSLRSLGEDSAVTRALMSVIFHAAERGLSKRDRVIVFARALHAGRGPVSRIDIFLLARNAGKMSDDLFEERLNAWAATVFKDIGPEGQRNAVKAFMGYTRLTANTDYTRASLSRLFREVEELLVPSFDGLDTELGKLLWGPENVDAARAKVRDYVERHFKDFPRTERALMARRLIQLRDSDAFGDPERRMINEMFRIFEELETEK